MFANRVGVFIAILDGPHVVGTDANHGVVTLLIPSLEAEVGTDGVFVELGLLPNSQLVDGLAVLDAQALRQPDAQVELDPPQDRPALLEGPQLLFDVVGEQLSDKPPQVRPGEVRRMDHEEVVQGVGKVLGGLVAILGLHGQRPAEFHRFLCAVGKVGN